MPRNLFVLLALSVTVCAHPTATASDDFSPKNLRRVVFVGDSITYAGQYIENVEAILRLRDPKLATEFLNVGLPSETVSGLSEPGHAGGQFPRPNVHERLQRVLDQLKPDLLVACYGMNDGIYYPYGPERFEKYQQGMTSLRSKASAAGAKVLHLTPPVFDANPIRSRTLPAGQAEYRQPYVGYDEVLNLYGAWLLAQRGGSWEVVDIHGPMDQALQERKKSDPSFRYASDGVHADAAGHWLIAQQLLKHWGVPESELRTAATVDDFVARYPHGKEVLALVQKKQRMNKDSVLTATGHLRPGMAKGLSRSEAEKKTSEIDSAIRALLSKSQSSEQE